MAAICHGSAVALSFLLLAAGGVRASDASATANDELYDRPVLVIDPGMHAAPITTASGDNAGRWLVTGSVDKTLRVWSVEDGSLANTIRLPAGPGYIGKPEAVAISPDGRRIAAGGWTTGPTQPDQIYIFDRETGAIVRRIQGLPNGASSLRFSRDGHLLAALAGGLRIYSTENWVEIGQDEDYPGGGNQADFAQDGRLATTSNDNKVRLYSGDLTGKIKPSAIRTMSNENVDDGIAFTHQSVI
jgi:WD40 repeat protein